jgi:hypothetical protein
MTCEERKELFLLDAIGSLEPAESETLRAHLADGCPACAAAAAEAEEIAALLPVALQQEMPSPEVLEKLMVQIATKRKIERPRSGRWLMPAALAACVSAVITGLAMWQWLGEAHRLVTMPDLQYVNLAGSAPQPQAHGRVFWDKEHQQWHAYFFDMKPPPPGKQYEMWFITARGEKLPGGTFDVDEHGNARLIMAVPSDAGAIAAAAVTDEKTGGVRVPAGAIQLLGKVD